MDEDIEMLVTIRNCRSQFRFVCPKSWDELANSGASNVRHCASCNRDVYYCKTDAETQEHAQRGDCIAREVPNVPNRPEIAVMGRYIPHPPRLVVEFSDAEHTAHREGRLDYLLEINYNSYIRACVVCRYPIPSWDTRCRICGLEVGRAGRG